MHDLGHLALIQMPALQPQWDRPTAGDWANVLATLPLFTGVSKRRLRKLTRNGTIAEFAPGETIVFAGDADDTLYIILSGRARTTSTGNRRLLRVGDYFGEITLIDGRPDSATVVATNHVEVMKLPSRSVLELARQHPAITLAMLKNLTARLRWLEAEGARAA
jgi:CRP/FNR family transcriptional regulator, cyclic AMP receptor protein